jgi:hypothetical protein
MPCIVCLMISIISQWFSHVDGMVNDITRAVVDNLRFCSVYAIMLSRDWTHSSNLTETIGSYGLNPHNAHLLASLTDEALIFEFKRFMLFSLNTVASLFTLVIVLPLMAKAVKTEIAAIKNGSTACGGKYKKKVRFADTVTNMSYMGQA